MGEGGREGGEKLTKLDGRNLNLSSEFTLRQPTTVVVSALL